MKVYTINSSSYKGINPKHLSHAQFIEESKEHGTEISLKELETKLNESALHAWYRIMEDNQPGEEMTLISPNFTFVSKARKSSKGKEIGCWTDGIGVFQDDFPNRAYTMKEGEEYQITISKLENAPTELEMQAEIKEQFPKGGNPHFPVCFKCGNKIRISKRTVFELKMYSMAVYCHRCD